jgi:hypothetical protein
MHPPRPRETPLAGRAGFIQSVPYIYRLASNAVAGRPYNGTTKLIFNNADQPPPGTRAPQGIPTA